MMISMLEGEINLQAVVIANVLGFGLMLIVMLNKRYRHKIITLDDKLYNWMCYLCMVLCLMEIATFLVDGKGFSGARQLNVGGNALLYLLSALFAYLWCFYLDYKCFSDLHRLRRWYGLAAIPAVGVLLVCVANLFVPIMFWVGEDNQFYRTNWVVVCYLVTFGYLAAGALLVSWHRRKENKSLSSAKMVRSASIRIIVCTLILNALRTTAPSWRQSKIRRSSARCITQQSSSIGENSLKRYIISIG